MTLPSLAVASQHHHLGWFEFHANDMLIDTPPVHGHTAVVSIAIDGLDADVRQKERAVTVALEHALRLLRFAPGVDREQQEGIRWMGTATTPALLRGVILVMGRAVNTLAVCAATEQLVGIALQQVAARLPAGATFVRCTVFFGVVCYVLYLRRGVDVPSMFEAALL
jgi:hypothetical protein